MQRLLILGGTGDAAELAREASLINEFEVIYSLAGRTQKPNLPDCETRIGGFGGTEGLAAYLNDSKIDRLIDATHPFAATMASHAAAACATAGIPRLKFRRPAWAPQDVDWISVTNYQQATEKLSALGSRVFLAIGTKDLAAFSSLADKWFLIRAIEQPTLPLPLPAHDLLLKRGPFDEAHEQTLLITMQIDVLVTKNSGGVRPAKLQAAYNLDIPIIMIEQPTPPPGEVVDSVTAALKWLKSNARP